MRRRGFTLIELLLVCLLIATLVAIVAPSLGGSTQRSRLDGTARALVALARGARARASAEGRTYFLVVDGDRHEVRVARARDPLSKPEVEGDSEVEGDDWVEGAPWARRIDFEEGISLVWAQVGTQPFAGTGGLPPTASGATFTNTTTSTLYGPMAPPAALTNNMGTDVSLLATIPPPVITYPRVAFNQDGTADDAFFDLAGADDDRVRVVIEAASGRTRILDADEYKAALAGTPPPLATDAVQADGR